MENFMEIFNGDNASEKVLKLINNKYKLCKGLKATL